MTLDHTSTEHLSRLSDIDPDKLIYPTDPGAEGVSELSAARRESYEMHWGTLVFRLVQKHLAGQTEFDRFWEDVHFDENLEVYRKGRKFARHQKRLNVLRKLARPLSAVPDVRDLPFDDLLLNGTLRKASVREVIDVRRDTYLDLVSGLVSDNTAFVDLGSGWGRFSTLFASRFPTARHYAGELAEGGRKAITAISDHFGLGIHAFAFDYANWGNLLTEVDWSAHDNVIVFSNHSIEQVTYIDARMFEAMLGTGVPLHFVHVEPVGWQLKDRWEGLHAKAPGTQRHFFNKNLVAVADHLQREGLIEGLDIRPDFFADGNLENAGTLVRFDSAAR